jgi:CheY-like chemotaxis protein
MVRGHRPLVSAKNRQVACRANHGRHSPSKRRMAHVLVVDDDELMRSLLAVTLGKEGHAVVLARNGREALERLEEHAFHLVVTDMLMPEMDGLQLIMTLRKTKPELPIIAMSGGSPRSRSCLEQAQELGATCVLAKPFQPKQLFDAIHHVVDRVAR